MDYKNLLLSLTVVCLMVLAGKASSAERRNYGLTELTGYSLTTGLEYESGDYGTSSKTDVWRVPIGLGYLKGPWSAGINTSFLSASSTGAIIISGRMGRMSSISGAKVSSASGIGDVNMYASYQLPQTKGSKVTYHVTGRIKFGTADENKGLGTGENDYAVEGGFLTSYQKVFVFGNLGYQISGDSATVNYDDVFYLNAGATYPIQPYRSIGAKLDISQAATPGFDDPATLTLYLNQGLDKQRSLFFYVLLGLSNGSPDSGVGVDLTLQL